ncbi:ATP-binding protein [Streptomyces winkii]|uniref:ATP-binding protein n=1 Tax=Streptomyces winkii TaxID=3051178 RepID=UPI0028D27B6C|nr:ATP-binding protein [Streptomyces sp. DSM 40971]
MLPLSVPPTQLRPPRPPSGTAAGADSHALRLPAEDVSVPRARHAMDRWLGRRGASPDLREQAALVLSELVTNAVTHTDSAWIVCATSFSPYDGVRVEVHDDDTSSRAPQRRSPTAERESGRGLFIVETLADCWGVTVSPVTRGSAVWAQLQG